MRRPRSDNATVKLEARRAANVIGYTLCAVGTGAVIGLLSTGGIGNATGTTTTPMSFAQHQLLPGTELTGTFDVPAGSMPLTPYMKATDLSDGCVADKACTPHDHKLSDALLLDITAPDGATWHGNASDLATTITLPGGDLSANSAPRTYAVTLALPKSLGNDYQDRTVALDLQWGGMDDAGDPVTAVTASAFPTPSSAPSGSVAATGGRRGAGGSRDGGSSTDHHGYTRAGTAGRQSQVSRGIVLPFTGADIVVELIASASAIAAGLILILAARRRWRPAGRASAPARLP
jgi:hypothetical protein